MITKYTEYIKESLTTKQSIKEWLDRMSIENYTINDDLTVDVDGDVYINDENLITIPFKFNKINGYFDCSFNNLTSLKGSPTTINGRFYCNNNELTTLEYCPTTINGEFYCDNNNLEDINDLDINILLRSNLNNIAVKQEVYDKYFEYWIDKDIRVVNKLKDVVSDSIKHKYKHIFNANNFDLI